MTVEEIKSAYSMKDILARYGMIPNRSGFCKCPFHSGDNTASLKIYDKDFNCFGCGANGDIFTFVQKMEGLSFRDAFLALGGTYDKKKSFSARRVIYQSEKTRVRLKKAEFRDRSKKYINNMLISIYRAYMDKSEPYSDTWCDCYNALQYQLYLHGELNGIPY